MGLRTGRPRAGPAQPFLTFNRVQVGLGGPLLAIDHENAQLALQDAVDQLASSGGGELYVHPAHLPDLREVRYTFADAVRVDVPNVTLRFAPGAILDFAAAQEMFLIRAPGFRCEGAHVVHSDLGSRGRSCFRVGDPATPRALSDDAVFVDCRFELAQNGAPTLGFSAIRAEGPGGSPRRGLRVEGCVFDLQPGQRQSSAWQGDEPHGLCAVRARDSLACTITGNLFRGPSGTQLGNSGPMIYLDGAGESVIASNVFGSLDLVPSSGSDGTLVRVSQRGTGVGHRTVITGNVFGRIDARYVLELVSARYDQVTSNSFSEIGPNCHAVISARGPDGQSLVVSANVFRGVTGHAGRDSDAALIRLDGMRGVVISANTFARLSSGSPAVVIEPGTCSDVHICSAQATSEQQV